MSSMLQVLKNWFNGSRDYHRGVSIFCMISEDDDLKSFFRNHASDYTQHRLLEEMENLYHTLNKPAPAEPAPEQQSSENSTTHLPKNADLEEACDQKAKLLYKEMMNDRAVLFNLARAEGWDDANKPDLVEQRRVLALKVVGANYAVSQAYDDLAHVREHGRLPAVEDPARNVEITDVRLGVEIANTRSSITKLRQREQTPERVVLIQAHQEKLGKLLQRWQALNSTHEE